MDSISDAVCVGIHCLFIHSCKSARRAWRLFTLKNYNYDIVRLLDESVCSILYELSGQSTDQNLTRMLCKGRTMVTVGQPPGQQSIYQVKYRILWAANFSCVHVHCKLAHQPCMSIKLCLNASHNKI